MAGETSPALTPICMRGDGGVGGVGGGGGGLGVGGWGGGEGCFGGSSGLEIFGLKRLIGLFRLSGFMSHYVLSIYTFQNCRLVGVIVVRLLPGSETLSPPNSMT